MSYAKNRSQTAYQMDFYDGTQNRSGYWARQWNIQPPPYRAPLEFSFYRWFVNSYGTNNPYGFINYPQEGDGFIGNGNASALASNKSYESLVNAVGSQSQWANNMLEAHESISMIEKRGLQLARFASQLRKGHFGDALQTIGSPSKSTERRLRKAKSFGDQFLEVHFGWQPAVEDIGNSLNTLSKTDFGIRKVTGVGHSSAENFSRTDLGLNNFIQSRDRSSYSARSGALVRVQNSNAFLANQFGVANPLSILWEAVPYSFVVDWFSNVGQCLSAMTDFMGLSVEHAYTTTSEQGSNVTTGGHPATDPDHHPMQVYFSASSQGVNIHRVPQLVGPKLALKPFKGFSLVRGATAISLLLQKL